MTSRVLRVALCAGAAVLLATGTGTGPAAAVALPPAGLLLAADSGAPGAAASEVGSPGQVDPGQVDPGQADPGQADRGQDSRTPARTGPDDRLAQRLERACSRIPRLLERAGRLQDRLGADASTKGSIARLEARVTAAEAAGRTDLVVRLKSRLVVRERVQAELPERVEQLRKARAGICADVATATGR